MFHLAPSASRESILAHGLDHRKGQRPGWGGPVPDGNFLAPNEAWLRQHASKVAREVPARDVEMDVWEVDVSGLDLRPDPYFALGLAVEDSYYCAEPIPAARLRLHATFRPVTEPGFYSACTVCGR